ncbi:kirola-like protein [Tanacetum coccineum]
MFLSCREMRAFGEVGLAFNLNSSLFARRVGHCFRLVIAEWSVDTHGYGSQTLTKFQESPRPPSKTVIPMRENLELWARWKGLRSENTSPHDIDEAKKSATLKHLVTWTVEYEKLNPSNPDPDSLMDFYRKVTKDIETHHLKN